MNIRDYLKDRTLFLLLNFLLSIMLGGILLLINTSSLILLMMFCIWYGPLFTYLLIEYLKQKRFYKELYDLTEGLEQKYLLPEIMKEPEFMEGKLLHDLLRQTNKAMHEQVKRYRDMEYEYREYIETWVHEIKTPIASTRLIIENNQNEVTKSIHYEMKKIEQYIEQVLYYSRSNNVSKDYIIKEVSLETVVRSVIKKNARDFISKKILVDMEGVEGTVYSDAKWLEFILNQVIGNSMKYMKETNPKLTIDTIQQQNNIVLNIEDNGIGIMDKDVPRVFEKGFTGENGRRYGKSTGIGLYLCKKLCEQLGLGIYLTSKVGEGTKVSIIFPLGRVNLFNRDR